MANTKIKSSSKVKKTKDKDMTETEKNSRSKVCPGCCYSDGRENYEDGSWYCWRCGDSYEP